MSAHPLLLRLDAIAILALVAMLDACGFSGTEVGNGAKESKGGRGEQDKQAKASAEPSAPPADSASADNDDPKGDSPDAADTVGDPDHSNTPDGNNAASGEITSPTSEAAGDNLPADSPLSNVVVRLLAASCASPFSQDLASPIHLREAGNAVPLDLVAAKDDEIWTVGLNGGATAFRASGADPAEGAYAIAAFTPNDEPLAQEYLCGDAMTDDHATLADVPGTLRKVTVEITHSAHIFAVTWYSRLDASSTTKATLLRYETHDLGADTRVVLDAVTD